MSAAQASALATVGADDPAEAVAVAGLLALMAGAPGCDRRRRGVPPVVHVSFTVGGWSGRSTLVAVGVTTQA